MTVHRCTALKSNHGNHLHPPYFKKGPKHMSSEEGPDGIDILENKATETQHMPYTPRVWHKTPPLPCHRTLLHWGWGVVSKQLLLMKVQWPPCTPLAAANSAWSASLSSASSEGTAGSNVVGNFGGDDFASGSGKGISLTSTMPSGASCEGHYKKGLFTEGISRISEARSLNLSAPNHNRKSPAICSCRASKSQDLRPNR